MAFSWEQRKVSDLAEKTYGGGTPTTSNEAYWNGDIPWIQSSDVVDGKLLGVEPRKWITQDGLNNSAAQLIPGNSIAIITRVGVGKLAFMPYSYATSQDFLSLSKLNAEPLFTVYACYKKLQSELNAVQGTSIKGITKDELLAKNIMVPRYAEQQQIGAFFKQLDHLITLHQRKYFYKLTSAGTTRTFQNTNAWEQRKFDEVIIRIGTGLNPRDNFTLNSGGENYYVTIKNFEHGRLFLDDNCDKVDDEALKRIQERSDLCVNDILFTSIGRIGDCYLIKKQPINWNINESVFTLRPNLMLVEPEYIYHTIHSDIVLNQIINGVTGSTFKSIKIGDLKKVNIPVPSKAEQKQIAAFVSTIDNLITLHQRERILHEIQNN